MYGVQGGKCKPCEETHRLHAKTRIIHLKNFGIASPASTSPQKSRTVYFASNARVKDSTEVSLMVWTLHLPFFSAFYAWITPHQVRKIYSQFRTKRGESKLPRNTGSISDHLRYYVDYMHSPKLYSSRRHWVEGSKSSHALTPDWLIPSLCKCQSCGYWASLIRLGRVLAARSLCADPTRRRRLRGKVEAGQWKAGPTLAGSG